MGLCLCFQHYKKILLIGKNKNKKNNEKKMTNKEFEKSMK